MELLQKLLSLLLLPITLLQKILPQQKAENNKEKEKPKD
jgi:hypothetical protein